LGACCARADGTVCWKKCWPRRERFISLATEEPPTFAPQRCGSVYFELAGSVFGPAGPPDFGLHPTSMLECASAARRLTLATLTRDPDARGDRPMLRMAGASQYSFLAIFPKGTSLASHCQMADISLG